MAHPFRQHSILYIGKYERVSAGTVSILYYTIHSYVSKAVALNIALLLVILFYRTADCTSW